MRNAEPKTHKWKGERRKTRRTGLEEMEVENMNNALRATSEFHSWACM